MKKIFGISLFVLVIVLFNSCDYKEKKLRKEFVGKIWIIDEARRFDYDFNSEESERKLVSWSDYWSYILKPEKDSTIGVYREQGVRVENFKIKEDTLFLKLRKTSHWVGKEDPFHYIPYKFVKTSKYSAILFACDTNSYYYELYLTDLTDLFNEKPNNSKSKLYKQIKEYTWYPIQIKYSWIMGIEDLDEERPKYYVKERAFFINDVGQVNSLFGDSNSIYKFVDGDSIMRSRFYIYNTLNKEYSMTYYVPELSDSKLYIQGRWGIRYVLMKKIDPSILVNEKDLPKGFKFQCTPEKAQMLLKDRLKLLSDYDSDFYYDLNSIRLFRDDSENCEYVFTVIRKSRRFSDIYATIKLLFTTDEDGKFSLNQI